MKTTASCLDKNKKQTIKISVSELDIAMPCRNHYATGYKSHDSLQWYCRCL